MCPGSALASIQRNSVISLQFPCTTVVQTGCAARQLYTCKNRSVFLRIAAPEAGTLPWLLFRGIRRLIFSLCGLLILNKTGDISARVNFTKGNIFTDTYLQSSHAASSYLLASAQSAFKSFNCSATNPRSVPAIQPDLFEKVHTKTFLHPIRPSLHP